MSRNVVLVTVDALRADHCGPYGPPPGDGGSGSLTPTLDAIAAGGTTFETAIAPGPRTPSSMPVALTGEPLRGGGVYASWEEKRDRWRERRDRIRGHMARYRTLAERLSDRGYATGAVTANPWTTRDTGFDAGFDRFRAVDGSEGHGALARMLARVGGNGDWLLRWSDYYGEVRATLDGLDEPFFLWVFLLDTHRPYLAPRSHRAETSALGAYYANIRYDHLHSYVDDLPAHVHGRLAAAYRDTVRSVDRFLERLSGDLAGETGVVVHADHGEALADHGMYGHRPQLLFEENIRVPLVVGAAGDATGGGWTAETGGDRVADPVSLARLPDLVGDLADGSFAPAAYAGPYVRGRTEEGERSFVRGGSWKYVRGGEDWAYIREYAGPALYDLAADPAERQDVLTDHSDAASLFARLLDSREEDLLERSALATGAWRVADPTAGTPDEG